MTIASTGGTVTLGLYDTQSQLKEKADITYVDNKVDPLQAGHKGYATLAQAQAAQSGLAANTVVEVLSDTTEVNNGYYLWNGTTLTKTTFSPLLQANNYTDNKVATAKAEAIATAASDATTKANNAVTTANNYTDSVFANVPATLEPYITQAEAAATSANIAGKVYATAAEGVDPITGVPNGQYFNVRSSSNDNYIDEYLNNSGVAQPTGKSYPSSSFVNSVAEFTALPFKISSIYGVNQRVQLTNGDIVKSIVPNNTTNPNVDMTGWVKTNAASQIVDESGMSQQEINDLNKKKFYSVLEEGASITATASENYAAIQRTITKAQATNGVVWFPQLTSSFQDGVVPEGFKFSQQIVFPPKVSVKMDTPLIWTGDNNTMPLVYGQALPTGKSQFSEYIQVDVWLYNQNAADWGNDLNVGAWLYPHQFCRINLKVIQGFDCAVVLNGDKQGFVYNHIFVDELRGNRIGMKWLATNMGWVNENTFYKGRIASGPTPTGKEASNRYGLIGTTDNYSIENNHWLNPCFEMGYNTETVESVPIVLHNSSNNTFNNIRAENHKKWIARYTGASSVNLITSDYGRLDSTVPLANMGSDWLAVDDQTTYKNNLFINRKYDDLFYRPFSKIRVDNFRDRFYGLDGGFGAISGLASITPDAYPSVPTYSRGAYGDTVDADGVLSFGSASVRRVIRIKTNGAKKVVVKQSGSISGLAIKTFDTSKNLLYSTTTQYAKELNVNGSGGTAIATFGGSYALNTPLHGVSVIGLHADVAYVDLLIGGSGASIYSVEVSTTDSVQLEQIPFFSKKAHSVKPTLITNVDEFTVVYNSAFTGTGVYGWVLSGGAWRDLT